MSSGFWLNQDGLPLQFGTQKAIPEQGGDYLYYGENRMIETYIPLGLTTFGPSTVSSYAYPGLPSSFTGTGTPNGQTNSAGIVSMTTLVPLPSTAPTTVPNSSANLVISSPQLYVDQIDFEVVVAANAGGSSATGLTGVNLVSVNPVTQAFVQDQFAGPTTWTLVGTATNAKMAAGMHYTWYADGSAFGTATPPTTPNFLGNIAVPVTSYVLNGVTTTPTNAFISAIASGGPYNSGTAGGLMKLRLKYNYYGGINF